MTTPRYVRYVERLSPGAEPVEVELCQSREDVFDLLVTLERLAGEDPIAWKAAARQATATDWYVLAMFLSGTQRLDPFTGRPEWDNDFHFNWIRESQFEGDNVIDKSGREHGKTSIRCYVGVTAEVIKNPELSVGIFSFEKAAAEKAGRRLKEEWSTNLELREIWDDVFWQDPENQSPLWSMEKGLIVKRRIVGATPTVGWYSILELPVGSRFGLGILDDCETEKTVSTEEMRKQTRERVQNAFNLGGRACRWWVNGTHHHSKGLIGDLERGGGWKVRCHKAEDESKPAPDIAKLFDECNGMLPVREESGSPIPLPPEVRNIRLAGAPVYLHPLECALKRLRQGRATYYMHNMGDPTAGQDRRFAAEWIRWYKSLPNEWARGANLYILIDPSKGVGDPTFARVEACKSDETISWVGGLRRRLSPSEFGPAIFQLAMEWAGIGTLIEIRVEEFAQSTWSHNLRTYFDSRNQHVCRIVACSRHNTNNKESEGRQREWAGLEPMYRLGKRVYPEAGIEVFDHDGNRCNLVDYYLEHEYSLFPLPDTDDGLAADYLLAVKKGKDEAGREIELDLEFPFSEEEAEVAARSMGRWNRRHNSYDNTTSWSEGLL